MDFNTAIGQAWNDHATDPRAVAARWPDLRALVSTEPQLERLIGLTMHVHGPHLADWAGGAREIEALRTLPAYRDDDASGAAVRRCLASLALCAGDASALAALSASDRVRVHAMAAECLTDSDTAAATRHLQQAAALAEQSGLPSSDPMHRSIAVAANNLACTLEEKPARSTDERTLMIHAAQAARVHWALAGTWLETERAEYRLAMTWLKAGDAAQARVHAQACLDIVAANNGAALEQLFGWEAMGLAQRAAGDVAGHAQSLANAREAFDALSEDDKGWCRESVERLAAG